MTIAITTQPKTAVVKGTRWLRVDEAARHLHVSRGRVYQLVAGERVRSLHLHGLMYVHQADVQAYGEYLKKLAAVRLAARKRPAAAGGGILAG